MRPGRLLTQHPRQGGAYLGQMTFFLYKNAKMAQKWGRLFGKIRYLNFTYLDASHGNYIYTVKSRK